MGANHNIVRHPDTPSAAFAEMWQYLQSDNPYMILVKKQSKNSGHYLVSAFVTATKENSKVIDHQSVRAKLSLNELELAQRVYHR